ncbi:MAG: alpha-L-fucosidase, partial [Clostridia bacterium]|nr:alpha-L-fucosidase [Clostridia bacterium]
MVVRTAGNNLVTHLNEFVTHYLAVCNYVFNISFVFGFKTFNSAYCLTCDNVLQGTALSTGECGTVNLLGIFLLGKGKTAACSAESLMSCKSYNITNAERCGMNACNNKTCDMTRYAEYMRNQVRELLTNYGEIKVLWFDFSYKQDAQGKYAHL